MGLSYGTIGYRAYECFFLFLFLGGGGGGSFFVVFFVLCVHEVARMYTNVRVRLVASFRLISCWAAIASVLAQASASLP